MTPPQREQTEKALAALLAPDILALLDESPADLQADAEDILSEIPAEERRETERLLEYDPTSAAGIMTTEFVSVAADMSVEAALDSVRALARAGRKEAMYAIYATDAQGRVSGVLSLRE